MIREVPILRGETLFRENEMVYINRSDELQEYCERLHKHDFIELSYVVEGQGRHVIGDTEYNVSKGDVFVINHDVPHGFFTSPDTTKKLSVYNCVFKPRFIDIHLLSGSNFQDIASSFLLKSLFPYDHQIGPDLRLHGVEHAEIGDLFSRMHKEYKQMKKGYCEIIRAYLIELIVKIFRILDDNSTRNVPSYHKELVEKAIHYLRSSFSTEIRLEEVAMKSFVSKNYFSRLFKEVTGSNFSDYVQKLRIEEACRLLANTDMKVVDIASSIGFRDLKYFYELFKKHTGKTPKDFRK